MGSQISKSSINRVVITGVGIFTPAGTGLNEYWSNITSGKSGLRKISLVETEDLSIYLGGEIDAASIAPEDRGNDLERADRALWLARNACRRALEDSKIQSYNPDLSIGICLGSGAGPTQVTEEAYVGYALKGPRALRPKTVTRLMFNSISAHLGIDYKLRGPQCTIASACASSNMAMSRAVDLIKFGRQSAVLTGGVEMPLCRTVLAAWSAMRVCSNSRDPESCSLPFDRRRTGIALAEGSAMYVFESLEHAIRRGAKIYAEVLGYGENNDATHITQPSPTSQAAAINAALDDAGVTVDQVDYINAHGTGTELNDVCESEAIKMALGAKAFEVAISSTKSVFGHALGASGAIELPAIIGAFQHQMVPPTVNLLELDPRCGLDYVPCAARKQKVKIALSNSFAFGGSNSVLVLRHFESED